MSENKSLAWSPEKRLACFGHLLTSPEFARGEGSRVEPEWFGSETGLVKARMLQLQFQERFGRLPTPDEVKEGPGMVSESAEIRELVAKAVDLSLDHARRFRPDALGEEIRHWHKSLLFRAAHARAAQFYRQGEAESAYGEMEKLIAAIRDADSSRDRRLRWQEYREHFLEREIEYEDALTWGHPLFDSVLMPEAEKGCMLRGQSTILLSGTNRGKSRCMCSVCAANFLAGKAILWLVHEDPEVDVEMNFWCSLLRMTRGDFMRFQKTESGRMVMDELAPRFWEQVEMAFMPPTGLCVEDVVASIRRRHEDRIARTGKGFDLVISDYPKKLTARKREGDARHVISYIYAQFIGLALEYKFHVLMAYQTNREGHKAGAGAGNKKLCEHCRRNPVGERWILDSDAGEAFDPMQDCSNVISLNRDREMEKAGITVFYFSKTKASQAKGWAIACRGNYSWALTHAPSFAATAFQKEWASAAQLNGWLDNYPGVAVPESALEVMF